MNILQINSSARREALAFDAPRQLASSSGCATPIPKPTLTVRDLNDTPHPVLDEVGARRAVHAGRASARRSRRRALRWTTR